MNKDTYIENRIKLMNSIEDNSVMILFAGKPAKKTGDEFYQFTPDKNFYYLTGIQEDGHLVVLSKYNNIVSEKLFLTDLDLDKEMWSGKTLRDFEGKEISGINDVSYMKEFTSYLNALIKGKERVNLYLDLDREEFEEGDSVSNRFAKEIVSKYPHINIKNFTSIIAPLRMVKSENEIKEMRKAIEITIEGVKSLMKNVKAGMKEYEIEAYFDFECKTRGVKDYAFRTIAAAGKKCNNTSLRR